MIHWVQVSAGEEMRTKGDFKALLFFFLAPQVFAAHRIALACHSIYFSRAFILTHHHDNKLSEVILNGIDPAAFQTILRFAVGINRTELRCFTFEQESKIAIPLTTFIPPFSDTLDLLLLQLFFHIPLQFLAILISRTLIFYVFWCITVSHTF